jgi:glycosyltransferase involved in cell wall biosynthesis
VKKLSLVIITFNEERNIERCIRSVLDVADEIIVVDSFSSDKTPQICKNYNVRFYQRKWEGYSNTKNYANSLATNDYIFSIDADEALSEELKTSIIQAKAKGFKGAYQMNRLTNYCGKWIKHGSWYPDKKIRIWNKKQGHWQGDIHEKIVFAENIKIHQLRGDLLHYSYYSLEDHYRQIDKFTSLSAEELLQKGKKYSKAKELFSATAKFIKDYVFFAGFLDGKAGFRIARLSAKATAMKYKKLKKLLQKHK